MALKLALLKFLKNFFLSIVGILFSAVTMTLVLLIYNILSISSLVYRQIIIVIAKFKFPSATILKPLDQQMTNCAEMYKATHNYITFTAIVEGQLTVEMIREGWMERLIRKRCPNGKLQFPQLQQHITKYCGFDFWTWDTFFDINNYIFAYEDTSEGKEMIDKEKLMKIRTAFQSRLFQKGHGVWEMLLIPHYKHGSSPDDKGHSVMILKFHHGMADGFSIVKLLWGHLAQNPIETLKAPLLKNSNFCKRALRYLILPVLIGKALYQYPFNFVYNRDKLLDNNQWHTHVEKTKRKFEVWVPEPINKKIFRQIKATHGVSTMSIIVSGILGGIRRMMVAKGMELPKNMRVSYPIPLPNHPDYLTNHATMVEFLVPVATADSTERLLKTHRNIKDASLGPFPIALRFLTWLAGNLPYQLQKVGADYQLCSVCIPCVPLPRGEAKLFGCKLVSIHSVFFSTQADCGSSISVLGYNDQLFMSLQVESSLLSDPNEVRSLENYILEELHSLLKDTTA